MNGCRAYTTEEYSALLAAAGKRERCLISLGVRSGFRISELLSLDIIDVLGEYLILKKKNTKGKISSRVVPKHPECIQYIMDYIGDRRIGPLFLNRYNKRLGRIAAWEAICKVIVRAGVNGERTATHSMRKTFAKKFYEACGRDLFLLQEALGHSNIGNTVKYIQVNSDLVSDIIKNLK